MSDTAPHSKYRIIILSGNYPLSLRSAYGQSNEWAMLIWENSRQEVAM
jgi:hypothetical protein